jgi:GntR family transcriptional regulator
VPASSAPSRAPAADLLAGDGPLHARVARLLAERIRTGEWAVGSTLPAETALCEELGVSRQTTRQAMQALSERGLIVRRRGAGTRVIARQRSRRFTHSVDSLDEILRYPANTVRENAVVEMVECDAALQAVTRAPLGSSWLHIGAVRREVGSGVAVAWTDIYILPRYADVTRRRDHARTMVYEQIESAHGVAIDRAAVEIFPERLSPTLADRIGAEAGSPALVIVRRYHDRDGELFEASVTRHPEKRFVYAMDFRRSSRA